VKQLIPIGSTLPFEGTFNLTIHSSELNYLIPIYLGERYMARDNFKLIELNMALQKTESPKHKISLKITIDKDFGSIVVKAIDYKFPRIDTVHKAKFEMPSDEIIKRHI
jgi:hypothetical protein